MTPVKKPCALFVARMFPRTAVPLQVAPTEVQGSDCPKLCAKITRRDFNAQSCSQVYVRCAVAQTVAPSTGTSDTGDHAAAPEQCQLGVVPSAMPIRRMDWPTIESWASGGSVTDADWKSAKAKTSNRPHTRHHRYATELRQVCASTMRIGRFEISRRMHSSERHKPATRATAGVKKTSSLSIGLGLRGGRWPGPMVERDDLRCYFGRGWVTDGPQIAGRKRVIEAGSPPPGFLRLSTFTPPASGWFMPLQEIFPAVPSDPSCPISVWRRP